MRWSLILYISDAFMLLCKLLSDTGDRWVTYLPADDVGNSAGLLSLSVFVFFLSVSLMNTRLHPPRRLLSTLKTLLQSIPRTGCSFHFPVLCSAGEILDLILSLIGITSLCKSCFKKNKKSS